MYECITLRPAPKIIEHWITNLNTRCNHNNTGFFFILCEILPHELLYKREWNGMIYIYFFYLHRGLRRKEFESSVAKVCADEGEKSNNNFFRKNIGSATSIFYKIYVRETYSQDRSFDLVNVSPRGILTANTYCFGL